ncbi:hypothetical protein [Sorangium sp. So ce1000]|uniref:hypothetical protein n=1 Tax=Sorangium sp. So ce1000 TaxID=3133325 RepID=UPI003F6406B1
MKRYFGSLLSLAVGAFTSGCAVQAFDDGEVADIGEASAALMSGSIQLYERGDFSGHTALFDFGTGTTIDRARLIAAGLYGNVSSLLLFGVPSSTSVFLFEGDDASGRFVSVTGNPTNPVRVPRLPEINDRTSVVWAADHGLGSFRIGVDKLTGWAERFPLPRISRVSWRPLKIQPRPTQGFVDVIVEGKVRLPFPLRNRKVRIAVHVRPEVFSPTDVRLVYAGYERHVSPCVIEHGPICGRIEREIDENIDRKEIERLLDEVVNGMIGEAVAQLSRVPCPGGSLAVRRVNNLPTAVEFVVAETEIERGCLKDVRNFLPRDLQALVSLDRPASVVSTGTL